MDVRKPIKTIYGATLDRFLPEWTRQIDQVKAKYGAAIEAVRMPPKDRCEVPIVYVKPEQAYGVIETLKSECGYDFLSDLTATDELEEGQPWRFEVVYNLTRLSDYQRIRVKSRVPEGQKIQTIMPLWPAANWLEREVFDMFGVVFEGHPNLKRILMDYRFEGHPLRKDYPLRGYQLFVEPMLNDEDQFDSV